MVPPPQTALLETKGEGLPDLVLRAASGGALELVNRSESDLPPRLSGAKGSLDRGYALELDAASPIWREALPGEFWQVNAHAESGTMLASIPLATRLTFWFSHLRANGVLRTGLLELAPSASFSCIRYRVLNCDGNGEWKRLMP